MTMNEVNKVSGVFNGTGAAVYLCVGFVPRKVYLKNVENSTEYVIEWSEANMRCQAGASAGGWLYTNGVPAPVIASAGVRQYEGGDLMTSAVQTSVAYGEGIYLGWDLQDYRANNSYGASSGAIDTWTFDGTLSGHWNVAAVSSGARIGAGSKIMIKEASSGLIKAAGITAISNQGAAASEVTLSRAIGNGSIAFVGGLYDLAPIALKKVTPAGILLSDTTLNANDNTIYFEMEA
jgi:hypothetical protein